MMYFHSLFVIICREMLNETCEALAICSHNA